MLKNLYPQDLISKGAIFVSEASCLEIYPEEAKICQSFASQKRVEEFSKGRSAARKALKSIGIENFPLLKAATGNPIWPADITGSITHSNGIAIAAVAKKGCSKSIGIDLESTAKKRDLKLFEKTSTKNELAWILSEPEFSLSRGLQIFSAKEAIYKAFFELLAVKLTFQDVELCWQENYFQCELKIKVDGYFRFEVFQNQSNEFIFSALAL